MIMNDYHESNNGRRDGDRYGSTEVHGFSKEHSKTGRLNTTLQTKIFHSPKNMQVLHTDMFPRQTKERNSRVC